MKLTNIITFGIFQFFSLLFVLGYLLGILNIYFSDKNDYCAMTYMFEYPQFVRISVPENDKYPQYGLYAYSEGRFTERARKMWFDGVPVLFLPGNSGSHMQARSLASIALRKAVSQGYDFHFDYFTINYNEELSGLYGGVLNSQTEFAAACVAKILSLYKSNKYTKSVPASVILIGHSMGGLIASRLLAYPSTIASTNLAISLAAPLKAPVINFDTAMNNYYKQMFYEWDLMSGDETTVAYKVLISLGNGHRDVLMPSGLTSSDDSVINALTTSIPGVWVSPDHVGIVWCKQVVLTVNKYLFDIIDQKKEQLTGDMQLMRRKARHFFQANRSMVVDPRATRTTVPMIADAFWYEDNRRIYQISRPDISKTTYLMIRMIGFPQNRFVAIEGVNLEDPDWLFGCNAEYTFSTYRYCKHATSLSELSRWTGAATDFGKRRLATVNLHTLKELYPEWSHVIVKVSPTRKPIVLNVDINDLASRQITVDLPSDISFTKTVIKQETELNSLYYELLLPEFYYIHQAYLLYVEPSGSCTASQYHVSAEMHVPWAENHEYYHYFTHLKHSPMKLRLHNSNPNVTSGLQSTKHVTITLLLDPQCNFSISISVSRYHRLGQFARNYSQILLPYVAAIILLAARSNVLNLGDKGTCVSIHAALLTEGVMPYHALVFARFGVLVILTTPLSTVLENASWNNLEIHYFIQSLLVLPTYMIAMGILNITAAAVLVLMVSSSQLAYKLLFKIIWRGGPALAERVATGLEKVPLVMSAAIVCCAPLSCGAASLVAGAAFYSFLLSKMYEEYLEDCVYKLLAKIVARLCRLFKKTDPIAKESVVKDSANKLLPAEEIKAIENISDDVKPNTAENVEGIGKKMLISEQFVKAVGDSNVVPLKDTTRDTKIVALKESTGGTKIVALKESTGGTKDSVSNTNCESKVKIKKKEYNVEKELNNLNFHMMLFFMWMVVTLVNVPALLTWAKNFRYTMVLTPDTSYISGLVMSVCSACVWQMDGPRSNLRHYDAVATLLFIAAILILILGPFSLTVVNYGVTSMFVVITAQQILDKERKAVEASEVTSEDRNVSSDQGSDNVNVSSDSKHNENNDLKNDGGNDLGNESKSDAKDQGKGDKEDSTDSGNASSELDADCVCNENRIFNMFKNSREKLSFSTD